jgi:phosphoribosylformylglycinamidine cyclo-ligase
MNFPPRVPETSTFSRPGEPLSQLWAIPACGVRTPLGLTYKQAGVDHAGKIRSIKALVSAVTFARRGDGAPVGPVGGFAGFVRYGRLAIAVCTDSVGTKHLVARALHKFDTIGIDCVAMNVNDMVCHGAEPLAFVDYLALRRPDASLTHAIGIGLNRAARQSNVTLVGGETAIVPDLLKEFDLSGTAVGVAPLSKILDGRRARPGDVLIGISSSGVHCNGFTLIRKLVKRSGVALRSPLPGLAARSLGLELLCPTRLYVKPVLELARKVEVTGLANITGGGLRNLLRIKPGLGFSIDDPLKAPRIFDYLQQWGSVSDREMHQTFNMGLGFCALVAKDEEAEAVRVLRRHFPARAIGVATRGGGVRVESLKGVRYAEY